MKSLSKIALQNSIRLNSQIPKQPFCQMRQKVDIKPSLFIHPEKKIKQQMINPLKKQMQVNKKQTYRDLTIGFIGVGTISKAMVQGLCNPKIEDQRVQNVIVSPRNRKNSQELAEEFEQVQIAKTNQEVIDNSDWVVVGLLTTQIKSVLKDLKFKKNQTIINLAAMPNEEFEKCVNQCDKIVRACPLPPIALNVGATIVSPPHKGVQEMFDALGQSVAVKTSHETYSLQGLACLQGAQFGMMEATYDWMVNKQNIDPETAKTYVMGTFHSIMVDAMDKIQNKNHSFQDLIDEQTPGGLNEQNLKYLNSKGFNQEIQNSLDITYNKMVSK